MRVQVLLSCMYEKDASIIQRSNIQCDVVVINQCDKNKYEEFSFENTSGEICKAIFLSTTERGLSRSRNMAIKYATGDICVICDNDEVFVDNLSDVIQEAYRKFPQTSVMLFALNWDERQYSKVSAPLSYKSILQSNSPQITFRRDDINNNDIKFDIMMGSGTGNGGGEENKFLLDCRRMHLNLRYCSKIIATITDSAPSQWFKGYNAEFLRNLGWSSRRSQGPILGLLYSLYWITSKYPKYKDNNSYLSAMKHVLYGYFKRRE